MRSSLALIGAYARANLEGALEYRTSFLSEVIAMAINDVMWLVFWIAFYERFPAVVGWQRPQVVALWAVLASGFGIAMALFGNCMQLAGLIARGEIDFFLTLPRPVLLHAVISRMSATACGDALFGALAFGLLAHPSALDWALFLVLSVSSAGIFVGFTVALGSLGFWFRNGEGLAQQGLGVLINFSTYPAAIFRGVVKLILFTAIPAAFLGTVPVEILRHHRWSWLLAHLGVALFFLLLGSRLFALGLRRYESGNLFVQKL
jgi:ABC-2 type transport system permease protein